jgi:hypothetical protein
VAKAPPLATGRLPSLRLFSTLLSIRFKIRHTRAVKKLGRLVEARREFGRVVSSRRMCGNGTFCSIVLEGVAAGIWFDVLVYTEKVRGIIFLFDSSQA